MKKETPRYSKHFFCLSLLFTLSGGVISAPFNSAKGYTFYAVLVSVIVGLLLCVLTRITFKNTLFFKVLSLTVAVFCAVDITVDFCKFIGNSLMPKTASFVIALVFLALVFYATLKGYAALLKFAFVSALFTIVLILFFFFATADKFQISNVFTENKFETKEFLSVCGVYFKKTVLPIFLLPVFRFYYLQETPAKSVLNGVAAGYGVLFLTIINSLLIFGEKFAQRTLYPYAAAVSTVTFGSFFTRLDGLAYVIYFSAVLIRVTICFLVTMIIVSRNA